MKRFFEGIQWLLMWMVLYVAAYILIVQKHDDPHGFWNMGSMVLAFLVTVVGMWIRSLL